MTARAAQFTSTPAPKRCPRCGQIARFHRALSTRDGWQGWCVSCMGECARQNRARNRARHLAEGWPARTRANVIPAQLTDRTTARGEALKAERRALWNAAHRISRELRQLAVAEPQSQSVAP